MAMGQDTESTHKINSVLVPNNEPKEENVRKTILFTIAWENEYLGINLTKEPKNFCNENYRNSKKETEEDNKKVESHLLFLDQQN